MPRNPRAVRGIVDRYFAGFEHRIASDLPPRGDRDELDVRLPWNDMAKAICNAHRFGIEMFFFDEPSYWEHLRRRAPAITSRRGTWLVLGLRRYRDIHGVWPATLDEITQYIPPEAFSDPTSGEAFVYVRDNGDFRLYSKGPNGIDEGGRHGYVKALDESEDDIPLWPPPVMEPEREPSEEEIEEMRQQFEEMFGKDYAEALFKDDGNDKR